MTSTRLRLQIRSVPLDERLPSDDDETGQHFAGWVRRAVVAGSAPPAAVVVRDHRTDVIALAPVLQARMPLARFVAGMSRSTVDDAGVPALVGVIGVVRANRRGTESGVSVPMAVAFLVWPDNRWWYWKALIDSDERALVDDTEVVQRAVDGDPMPAAFGRWWSLGRRARMQIHLTRQSEGPATGERIH